MTSEVDDIRTPAEDDARSQAAVLGRLLALHPAAASFAELLREVAGDAPDFRHRDATERAVRDLIAAGLLRRCGGLLLPTLAALRFDELLDR